MIINKNLIKLLLLLISFLKEAKILIDLVNDDLGGTLNG